MSPAKKKSAIEAAADRIAEIIEEGLRKLAPIGAQVQQQMHSVLRGAAKVRKRTPSKRAKTQVKRRSKPASAKRAKTSRRTS
jgi:hypothetical protein